MILITAEGPILTRHHRTYLMSEVVSSYHRAGRIHLENASLPTVPPLNEADESDMKYFLAQLEIVLPVLGVNMIGVPRTVTSSTTVRIHNPPTPPRPPNPGTGRPAPVPVDTPQPPARADSPIFRLQSARTGVDAKAQVIDGDFWVLEGSLLIGSWDAVGTTRSTIRTYELLSREHRRLTAEGAIVVEGDIGRTVRDIRFDSPSRAASVILGYSANGRRVWVSPVGTVGEWLRHTKR